MVNEMGGAIVDSLKDRDFNDDGIPDMYLVTGPDGKKRYAWSSREAKEVWDKYVSYDKTRDMYFLDQGAVMVDLVKEARRSNLAEERKINQLSAIKSSLWTLERIIKEKKIKFSLF